MRERFRCPPVPRAARDGLRDRYMFLLAPKPQPDTMSYDNKGLRLPIRMKEVFGVQPDGHLLSVLRRCWCRCGLRARVPLPVGSSRANCRISAFRFGTQASQRGLRPRCVSSVFCPRLRCFVYGCCVGGAAPRRRSWEEQSRCASLRIAHAFPCYVRFVRYPYVSDPYSFACCVLGFAFGSLPHGLASRCFDIGACSWNLGCGVHGLVAQRYEGSTPLGDAGSSTAVRGVVSFVRLCCGSRNGVFLRDALRVRIGSSTGGQRRRCSSCSRNGSARRLLCRGFCSPIRRCSYGSS